MLDPPRCSIKPQEAERFDKERFKESFLKVIEAAGAGREEKATEISDRLQIPGKK